MAWRLFHDLESFLDPCRVLLGADPAEHTLPLSLVEQLRSGLGFSDEPPLFGLHEEEGAVTGAVMMTPPHNLVLAEVPSGTGGSLADALTRAGVGVPGVYGTPEATGEFIAAWSAATGTVVAASSEQRLYVLGALAPPYPEPPGRSRQATPGDLDLVASWGDDFAIEARGHPPIGDPAHARAREQDRVEGGRVWLWEDASGAPVSMAGRGPAVAGVARVGPVYTPPRERRRGYGSAVTTVCSAAALAAGAGQVVLFTDLANPTSNAIYQRIGYRPVSDRREVTFEDRA